MPGLLDALRQGAERDGAALRVAADEGSTAALAAIVEMAERVQRSDSGYARELAAWAPPPGSQRQDGVSPSSYPARPDRTSPYFPGRDFARGHARVQLGDGSFPQLMLRLGTVIQNAISVRRPPASVLLAN